MRNRERLDAELMHKEGVYDWKFEFKEGGTSLLNQLRSIKTGVFTPNTSASQTQYVVNFKFKNKMHNFEIKEKDGSITQYAIDHNGVIKQLYPKPFKYDKKYVAIYDDLERVRKSEALQRLRFGFVEAMADKPINSLCDVGYGNGSFLEAVKATKLVNELYGYDISEVDPPRGVQFAEDWQTYPYDVLTFWDVIEHFPDLSFLEDVNAGMIALSTPWVKFAPEPYMAEIFRDWFHRKPNEHLHFFNPESLTKTMKMYGWNCIGSSNFEDMVRRRGRNNILTAAFTR